MNFKFNIRQSGGLALIVMALAALIVVVIFWLANSESQPGPQTVGAPTATPAPTSTPGGGSDDSTGGFFRLHEWDITSSQDISLWHVANCRYDCRIDIGAGFRPGINDLQAYPIYIPNPGKFGEIAVDVDIADVGTTARVGIYEANVAESTGRIYPGTLIEDYGTIDTSTTGFKQRACTTCVNFNGGWYFLTIIVDSSTVQFEKMQEFDCTLFGTFNNGSYCQVGYEVDAYSAGHTAFPTTYPTPGPDLVGISLNNNPSGTWIGVQINDQ